MKILEDDDILIASELNLVPKTCPIFPKLAKQRIWKDSKWMIARDERIEVYLTLSNWHETYNLPETPKLTRNGPFTQPHIKRPSVESYPEFR